MARKKRPFWTVDCETDPFHECRDPKRPESNVRDPKCRICKGKGRIPKPFVWCVYDPVNFDYWIFRTPEEVAEFLCDKEVIVYAHNGGKFDYHYMRDYINQDEKIMVVAGRLARFKIGACEFRDSLNLFSQTRLADFSKEEIDYRIMEPDVREKPENWARIIQYLKYDCLSLATLVGTFVANYGMHFTQAGASMTIWSKSSGIPKPRSTPQFYNEYRSFYYGGRVQCFRHGHVREAAQMVDIRSAYPRAMCEEHPYSTHAIVDDRLPKKRERIGPCMIELEATSKGAFPLRGNHGELYFPEDEKKVRRYYVTGWELLAGLDTNTVKVHRIEKVHHFTETVNFAPFMQEFFEKRVAAKEAGLKAEELCIKILQNGLYGKFCANPSKYLEHVLASDERIEEWIAKGYIRCDFQWGRHTLLTRPLPEEQQRYYNIATGASVTGWVRAYWWRAANAVSGLIYGDTDSILARDVSGLDLGKRLGQWNLEFQADEWAVAGKKLYTCHKEKPWHKKPSDLKAGDPSWLAEWKVACKGVRLTPWQVIAAANGEEITHQSPVPNYSMHRAEIGFIGRRVRDTFKDMRYVGESFDREAA